ncbi:amino acid/polyamine/organocation transporter, APC superfamily [Saccharicrinis carchari]|uniref:Amino acid/polyamine/organocation transporter, APC superfamily n=1 Tax=Saccharicrinis carchari TaxID=1168039 RepID=A0A521D1P0_SACCC|nr:APC family permease [Saccharicrinis carchari]SMO65582.1 amino acid/polyamine/organocation transporter, APC superfamily [Saccharicrinis carchari]
MAKLKKVLSLIEVICVSAGVMVSSGLFILPSLAYAKTGPSMILSYLIGSLIMVPTIFTKAELVTAMPKTGGIFFFADRSMGPLMGTLAGFIGWFSLSFKSAFSLLAVGLFVLLLNPMVTEWQIKMIAVACCLFFTIINVLGVKLAGRFQVLIVLILVIALLIYIIDGLFHVEMARFTPFSTYSINSILATAGFIFISFSGTTKIAAIAGEVKNPRRNLPLGMFYSWGIVSTLYVLAIFVTIGVVPAEELSSSFTPISIGGGIIMGDFGLVMMSVAALLAFVSTGNAGLLAASRNPLAMGKEDLIPSFFGRITKRYGTPGIAIVFTGLFMSTVILFFDLDTFVKTASALVLLLFILANIALIFMRESNMKHYRPAYKSPLYPWMQIMGIVGYSFLLFEMGKAPLLIVGLFVLGSLIWYFIYARGKIKREYALLHVVERITGIQQTDQLLDEELREILLERDDITEKKFLKFIKRCPVLEFNTPLSVEEVAVAVADELADKLKISYKKLQAQIQDHEKQPEVIVHAGVACLSIPIQGHNKFEVVMIRDRTGTIFSTTAIPVYAAFVIVYSPDEWNFQFHSVSWIVEIAELADLRKQRFMAEDKEGLRDVVLSLWKQRKLYK